MDKVVAKLDESICDDRDSSLIASNGSAIRRNGFVESFTFGWALFNATGSKRGISTAEATI